MLVIGRVLIVGVVVAIAVDLDNKLRGANASAASGTHTGSIDNDRALLTAASMVRSAIGYCWCRLTQVLSDQERLFNKKDRGKDCDGLDVVPFGRRTDARSFFQVSQGGTRSRLLGIVAPLPESSPLRA